MVLYTITRQITYLEFSRRKIAFQVDSIIQRLSHRAEYHPPQTQTPILSRYNGDLLYIDHPT